MDPEIQACDHPDVAFLGRGGSALYYRCVGCGTALIVQGGGLWALRSRPATA